MPEISYVVEGRVRPHLGRKVRELWAFRDTAFAFAERNIRVQYKQAVLGIAWAVIQPLISMAIFTIAVGHLANVKGGAGVPYAAFALSVQVPWAFLQSTVSTGATATIGNSAMVRKVYFPREVLVFGSTLSSAVSLAIGFGLFLLLAPIVHAHISLWWLVLPALALALAVVGVGISLALAAFSVYYRDFGYVIPFALQAWWVASTAVPLGNLGRWRQLFAIWNPVAGILDSFRRVVAAGTAPDLGLVLLSLAQALVLITAGYWIFKRLEPNFSDVA